MLDKETEDQLTELADLDLGYPTAVINATWDELEENITDDAYYRRGDVHPDALKKVREMFERQMKAVIADSGSGEWRAKYLDRPVQEAPELSEEIVDTHLRAMGSKGMKQWDGEDMSYFPPARKANEEEK